MWPFPAARPNFLSCSSQHNWCSPSARSATFLKLKVFLFHTDEELRVHVCMHIYLSRYVLCYTHIPSIRVHYGSDFPFHTCEMIAWFRPRSEKRDCMHPVHCVPWDSKATFSTSSVPWTSMPLPAKTGEMHTTEIGFRLWGTRGKTNYKATTGIEMSLSP